MALKNHSPQPMSELLGLLKEAYYLDVARGVLWWDQHTVMPRQGNATRAQVLGLLAAITHDKVTDRRIGKLLEELSNAKAQETMSPVERAQYREALRGWRLATLLPRDLVQQIAQATAQGQETWLKAKEERNFKIFQESLQRILDLKRYSAELKVKHLRSSSNNPEALYDVLLEEFEPGMTVAQLTPIFDDLRNFLTKVVRQVRESGVTVGHGMQHALQRAKNKKLFPTPAQKKLSLQVITDMGFDFERGRLDESAHPFCGGHIFDTRLTSRYDEDQPLGSLYAAMHECGHGLYVQGLPPELEGTPAGEYRSLGIHESQSLIWENCVGHSQAFCHYLMPKLQAAYGAPLAEVEVDDLFGYINQVQPSLIRVDADDVTYPLHIIIRFQLERQLLTSELKVADLPEHWNQLYQEYLGVRPKDDAEGVLQDPHWSFGSFGYFPTYALGALNATQLFNAAQKEQRQITEGFKSGQFAPLRGWLQTHIHQQGSVLTTAELLQSASGSKLTTEYFKQFLRDKLKACYGIQVA